MCLYMNWVFTLKVWRTSLFSEKFRNFFQQANQAVTSSRSFFTQIQEVLFHFLFPHWNYLIIFHHMIYTILVNMRISANRFNILLHFLDILVFYIEQLLHLNGSQPAFNRKYPKVVSFNQNVEIWGIWWYCHNL